MAIMSTSSPPRNQRTENSNGLGRGRGGGGDRGGSGGGNDGNGGLPHFTILSRFVYFTPSPPPAAQERVQDVVHRYLAANFLGVSVSFTGNAMHVAYGGRRIGNRSTGNNNAFGAAPVMVLSGRGRRGIKGSGMNGNSADSDDDEDEDGNATADAAVMGNGDEGDDGGDEDPSAPIEEALEEAREEGALPSEVAWSFKSVLG